MELCVDGEFLGEGRQAAASYLLGPDHLMGSGHTRGGMPPPYPSAPLESGS